MSAAERLMPLGPPLPEPEAWAYGMVVAIVPSAIAQRHWQEADGWLEKDGARIFWSSCVAGEAGMVILGEVY